MIDTLNAYGKLTLHIYRKGSSVEKIETPNLITATGLDFISELVGGGARRLAKMGVGTGSTAPLPANTALEAEVAKGDLVSLTAGSGTSRSSFFLSAGLGNGNILREAGLFSSAPEVMVARTTFSGIVKDATISILFEWNISFTSS